jgi:hypothetical protein
MNCGSGDFICYVLGLLAEYGIEISAVLKWWPWVEDRILGNLQAIIGLAGFSFGLWKWWYFRERVLHKRLKEYLNHQDARLLHARSYVLEALYRPGAVRRFAEPLFAVRPLRRVLRRTGWSSLLLVTRLETAADHLLNKALRRLEGRLEAAETQMAPCGGSRRALTSLKEPSHRREPMPQLGQRTRPASTTVRSMRFVRPFRCLGTTRISS